MILGIEKPTSGLEVVGVSSFLPEWATEGWWGSIFILFLPVARLPHPNTGKYIYVFLGILARPPHDVHVGLTMTSQGASIGASVNNMITMLHLDEKYIKSRHDIPRKFIILPLHTI